eukprot:8459154-Prorocentrum_lima.AAC.1
MTSSLVGSEMCIRDRVKQVSGVSLVGGGPGLARGGGSAGAEHARCFTSVSYTHLTLPTICSV